MAGIGNCSEFQDFSAGTAIELTTTGTGKLSDPEAITVGVQVSTATDNIVEIGADGGLYVGRATAGNAVVGATTSQGIDYPVDANNDLLINVQYDDASFPPFNSGTGTWTLPRLTVVDKEFWPFTCAMTSGGKRVYKDRDNASTLFVEPDRGLFGSTESVAATTYAGVTYTAGAIYNQLQPTVTTVDPCGRALIMVVHHDFGGFEVQLQGNDQIIMNHQIRNPLTNAWTTVNQTRAQASGPDNPSTIFMTVGQYSLTRRYAIPATNGSVVPGMRLQVQTVVGNPSVGTNVTNNQVRANRMGVYLHETDSP